MGVKGRFEVLDMRYISSGLFDKLYMKAVQTLP